MSEYLFKSSDGLVKYFVRPEDYFVLNSLERLDADEYLYRVLKNEGYQRIVFLNSKMDGCKYYAYDKLSHLSFNHLDFFKNVNVSNAESLAAFYTNVKKRVDGSASLSKGASGSSLKSDSTSDSKYDKIAEYGKREVGVVSTPEELLKAFRNNISQALEAENIKTAVVVELAVIQRTLDKNHTEADKIASELGAAISALEENNKKMQNILVFTAEKKEDLVNLVNDRRLQKMHAWTSKVQADCKRGDLVSTITKTLTDNGCLQMAGLIGTDEIANLLLRKKIIEDDKWLQDLPFSKVYPLAEKLRAYLTCEQGLPSEIKEDQRATLPFSKISYKQREKCIIELNSCLDQRDVAEELIECAKGLKAQAINRINYTGGVELFRVYHRFVKYIESDEWEKIIAKFEKLKGKEIQQAKENVINAVNYFVGMNRELEQKKKQGETVKEDNYPYYNMAFLGAPGTGKTTIARLVAELMCARDILPTSKVVELQASTLGSSEVHGVQDRLFEAAERANGGVLLIDELASIQSAYEGGNLAEDFMRGLVAVINRYRNTMCVILCGYKKDVDKVLTYDEGSKRRFHKRITLESYGIDTLMEIFKSLVAEDGKTLGEGVEEKVRKIILADKALLGESFGNVGYIKDQLIGTIKEAYLCGNEDNAYTMEVLMRAYAGTDHLRILEECDDTVQSILGEFDKLEGAEIKRAKEDVIKAIDYFEYKIAKFDKEERQGIKHNDEDSPYHNMVFLGAPGTGKTTIARLVGRLMYAKGILPSSKVTEVQAGKLGSSKVQGVKDNLDEVVAHANGGVLLIDELASIQAAYEGGNLAEDFAHGLVEVINNHRKTLCVILCGYEEDVNRIISFDNGLSRRLPRKIKLESYGIDTLVAVFKKLVEKDGKSLGEGVEVQIRKIIRADMVALGKKFGNMGYIKDELMSKIEESYVARAHAARGQFDDVYTIEDVNDAFPQYASAVGSKDHGPKSYKKISRSVFEALPKPYGVEVTESKEAFNEATDPAVLYIITDRGYGTAFLVTPDGYAITCNHVIEGATDIKARLRIKGRIGGDDTYHPCEVINTIKDLDLAVIKLSGGSNFPYLSLAPEDRMFVKGEDFLLSGYPFGEEMAKDLTTFSGNVASSELQTDEFGYMRPLVDGQAKRGNSGSPLVSKKDGCVIGVLLGSATNGDEQLVEEINYMRPIKYFWEKFLI